jgi:hypothetical protein
LIPSPRIIHLGRGKGIRSEYPAGTTKQLLAVQRVHQGEKRFSHVRFLIWLEGYPIPYEALKASFNIIAIIPASKLLKNRLKVNGNSTSYHIAMQLLGGKEITLYREMEQPGTSGLMALFDSTSPLKQHGQKVPTLFPKNPEAHIYQLADDQLLAVKNLSRMLEHSSTEEFEYIRAIGTLLFPLLSEEGQKVLGVQMPKNAMMSTFSKAWLILNLLAFHKAGNSPGINAAYQYSMAMNGTNSDEK